MLGIDIPKVNLKEVLIIGGALALGYAFYQWIAPTPVKELLENEPPVPYVINDVRPVFKDKVKQFVDVAPDVGIGMTNYGDMIYKKTYPTRTPDSNTIHNPYYMELGRPALLIDTSL